MTEIKFLADKGLLCGFCISGHSTVNCDDIDGKTVCSAVSSAAYMAANTIIEIIGDEVTSQVDDGYMKICVKNPSEKTKAVLEGFKLHIQQLSLEYDDRISILSEV